MSYSVACKSIEGNLNQKFQNDYTVTWQVLSSVAIGPIEAIAAVGVNLYDSYNVVTEYDTYAVCLGRNAVPVCDGEFCDLKQWIVTISYGRVEFQYDNPLDEPVKVNINFTTTEAGVDQSIYGEPIINRAGEPFAEAVTKLIPQSTISFERNEASYDMALSYYYTGTINLYDWKGIPAGCAMLVSRSASQQFNQNIGFYWTVSYEFQVNLAGYKKYVLNQGLRCLAGLPPKLVVCTDDNKQPTSTPVLLLADGSQAPKGSTPLFLEFEVYNQTDFSVFGF